MLLRLNTCCWLLKALVLLQTLISASSGPLGAGCIWRSSISADLPESQQIEPLPQCQEGELHWYYPTGKLVVTFTHETKPSTFELCVQRGEHIKEVLVKKRNGRSTRPTLKNNKLCENSENGQVVLEFVSKTSKDTDRGQNKIPRIQKIEYERSDQT